MLKHVNKTSRGLSVEICCYSKYNGGMDKFFVRWNRYDFK
jgi:hypothetical protein